MFTKANSLKMCIAEIQLVNNPHVLEHDNITWNLSIKGMAAASSGGRADDKVVGVLFNRRKK